VSTDLNLYQKSGKVFLWICIAITARPQFWWQVVMCHLYAQDGEKHTAPDSD